MHEYRLESVNFFKSNELFFVQRPKMPPETIIADT